MSEENTGVLDSAALNQQIPPGQPPGFTFVPPPEASALPPTPPPPPPPQMTPPPLTAFASADKKNDSFTLEQFAAPPVLKVVEDAPGTLTALHLKSRFLCLDSVYLGLLKISSGLFDENAFNNALRGNSPGTVFTRSSGTQMPSGIILFPEKGPNGTVDAIRLKDPAHRITGKNKHLYMQDAENIIKSCQAAGVQKTMFDPGMYASSFLEIIRNYTQIQSKTSKESAEHSVAAAAGLSLSADALTPKSGLSKLLPEIAKAHGKGDRTGFYAGIHKAAAVLSAAARNTTEHAPSLWEKAKALFIKEKRGEISMDAPLSAEQEFNIPAQGQETQQSIPPSHIGGRAA